MFAQPTTPEPPWLAGLNDAQRRAVLHDGDPLLVVAGAGTGKTRTLAARVARLIADGAAPERILLLTFTRRAAQEMIRRALGLVRDASVDRVWGGTFHGVAHRLLRRFGSAVGLTPGFTVLDQGDAADLFGLIRAELGFGESKRRFPKKETIAALYSRMVNSQTKLNDVVDAWYPWCSSEVDDVRSLVAAYTERKRRHNVVDFDDLLLYWRAMAESARPALDSLFDHVLVDEYQDTNRIQADILASMCPEGRGLTVVGDDAQAIYAFRAASVDGMLEFPSRYPGTVVVTLEQNYRSTPPILAVANAVTDDTGHGFDKRLWSSRTAGARPVHATCADETSQSEWVSDNVLEHRERGVALRDQSVLFRTGHHSAGLEIELSRRNVPFVKFGGLRFLEVAHVKDLVAMLRILDNPHDELAWTRVVRLFAGVGPATAGKVLRHLGVSSQSPLDGRGGRADPLSRFLTEPPAPLPAVAREDYDALRDAFQACRHGPSDPEGAHPGIDIEHLEPVCARLIERRYDDAAVRMSDIRQLGALAAASTTRSRFIADLTLDPPKSSSDLAGSPHLDDDYLTLSTIHSAKGGEWRVVHVIHAADGNIPSDMALHRPGGLDEERRLLYVALTRARDALFVSYPVRFHHRRFGLDAAHSLAQPSRFLDGVLHHFDKVAVDSAPGVVAEDARGLDRDPVTGFVADLLG